MSIDYYLIAREKRVYMPIYSMGSCHGVDEEWLYDFILLVEQAKIELVSEFNLPLSDEDETLQEMGWKFINSWHPHPMAAAKKEKAAAK